MIGATVLGNDGWCSHRILISSRESEVPLSKLDSWSFLGFYLFACFVCLLFVFKKACKVVQAGPGLNSVAQAGFNLAIFLPQFPK